MKTTRGSRVLFHSSDTSVTSLEMFRGKVHERDCLFKFRFQSFDFACSLYSNTWRLYSTAVLPSNNAKYTKMTVMLFTSYTSCCLRGWRPGIKPECHMFCCNEPIHTEEEFSCRVAFMESPCRHLSLTLIIHVTVTAAMNI